MAMRSGRSNNLARSGEMTAAIRSGRFQLTIPAAQEAPITHGVTGLSYRIFNTGKTEFSVQASGVAAVPLKTGMSVDLKVQAGGVINIANPSAKEITVRGIYEQLGDPWNPVRGGRFISDTNDDIDIIRERAGAYCRIFNSSKNTVFKVVLSNRNQVQVVPRCSVDVVIDKMVTIKHVYTSGDPGLKGVYDYVGEGNPIRSGRFRFWHFVNPGTGQSIVNPAQPQPIVDLRHLPNKKASYRVFNSGENPIQVYSGASAVSDWIAEDQSFDVAVETGDTVKVASEKKELLIEGIYELLGVR